MPVSCLEKSSRCLAAYRSGFEDRPCGANRCSAKRLSRSRGVRVGLSVQIGRHFVDVDRKEPPDNRGPEKTRRKPRNSQNREAICATGSSTAIEAHPRTIVCKRRVHLDGTLPPLLRFPLVRASYTTPRVRHCGDWLALRFFTSGLRSQPVRRDMGIPPMSPRCKP